MQNNYSDFRSTNLRPFRAYETDFTEKGNFYEEVADAQICLCASFYPGMRIEDKWVSTGDSDDESYLVYLEYKNKEHVEVYLMSQHLESPADRFEESYDFAKEAAKRFFLVNDIVNKISECEDKEIVHTWGLAGINPPTWEDVETLLNHFKFVGWQSAEPLDTNSWHKSMTIDEAKELMEFLQVEVEFPN